MKKHFTVEYACIIWESSSSQLRSSLDHYSSRGISLVDGVLTAEQ
jgi:hypothetical protein